ncbi:FAD-dependent oxidoreductase, partial [Mycobacteroides abscessus]|uniref:FAD-dependent oxidoreductase n=1 Tax=Mycobacteroides abscessus TaxID=36809 RepID=UPI0013F3DAD5
MNKKVVVIGHGMVGHRFVQVLRERDATDQWQVTVLGEEADAAYDRVALSSYIDSWDRDTLALTGNDYAEDPMVTLHLGDPVVGIDRTNQTVSTAAGTVLDYDALVMATGSYPFVPPVPGGDAEGCFVYRTMDDLDAIKATADKSPGSAGVVIGGGLLGLEAALQVDEGGGALLTRLVTDLGLTVHTSVSTQAIEKAADGTLSVQLSDGSTIDASVLVFSAGIRPRDELARECGLELAERGGIFTDLGCQTSDLHIYAIGEVAAIEGRCYGLVAPGYTTAEIVADRLLGGSAQFPGADLSTKLKLLGVDVASFGDAHATADGALEVVFNDATKGTYAKLVVSDDARTLLGGILVGDASAYGTLRPMLGRELPADPASLIAPSGAEIGVGALPDDAQICSCNAVTKGA